MRAKPGNRLNQTPIKGQKNEPLVARKTLSNKSDRHTNLTVTLRLPGYSGERE